MLQRQALSWSSARRALRSGRALGQGAKGGTTADDVPGDHGIPEGSDGPAEPAERPASPAGSSGAGTAAGGSTPKPQEDAAGENLTKLCGKGTTLCRGNGMDHTAPAEPAEQPGSPAGSSGAGAAAEGSCPKPQEDRAGETLHLFTSFGYRRCMCSLRGGLAALSRVSWLPAQQAAQAAAAGNDDARRRMLQVIIPITQPFEMSSGTSSPASSSTCRFRQR